MIKLEPYDLQINVIRSARRSVSLKLSQTKQLVVRAPYQVSDKDIEAIIQRKATWIRKSLGRLDESQPLLERDEQTLSKVFYLGKPLNVVRQNTRKLSYNGHTLFLPHYTDRHREEKAVFNWLKKEAERVLPTRFFDRENRLPEYASRSKGLSFRLYKSRWGCCSREKIITLNSRLVQLPSHLIDYVIDHELAHCTHLNHGKKFYGLLEEINTEHKNHHNQLKMFLLMNKQKGN